MNLKLPFLSFCKIIIASVIVFLTLSNTLQAQSITEDFDNITTLPGSGWVLTNNSSPAGSSNWHQGTAGAFNAQNGAGDAYIAADSGNTASTGTISNWLIAPNRTLRNGDVITFYTRKITPDKKADRLEVRMSTNGASTNSGSSATTFGDFSTLLLSVNPTLATTGSYPASWTQYTVTISGLSSPSSGRVAFRYFVANAGASGTNSQYIGIDAFVYTPYTCPTITLSPATGALTGGRAGSAYSLTLTQTGALGAPNFAITAGALPPGLTLSSSGTISGTPTATGTFNFTAMASDNSGCSGSNAYNITIICPVNPLSISFPDAICNNGESVTLYQGSPAGGTYSGTGVTGGMFDPAAGTQEIYYDYTDAYGCAFNKSATLTVNTAPIVTINGIGPLCKNSISVTLSSGSPAGGTYSGTGVSGNSFDLASGTQTISYAYTDANGCSNTANTTITVNDTTAITTDTPADICKDAEAIVLSFASPAGGTYSGTNVTSGQFIPVTAGANAVNYSYTDANGCTSTASSSIKVNELPVITATTPADVCKDAPAVALSFASPAGGTYSGTNVTAGQFTPTTVGVNSVNYSYTDANGCTSSVDQDITVSVCTAISDPTLTQGIKYYPNPTAEFLTVDFDQSETADILIRISDLQGKAVAVEEQNSFSGAYSKTFNLSELAKGIYYLELHIGSTTDFHKIVVQ